MSWDKLIFDDDAASKNRTLFDPLPDIWMSVMLTAIEDVMRMKLVSRLMSGPPIVSDGAASTKDKVFSPTEDIKGTLICRKEVTFIAPAPDALDFAAVNVMLEKDTED